MSDIYFLIYFWKLTFGYYIKFICYYTIQYVYEKTEIEKEDQLLDHMLQSRSLAMERFRSSRQQCILVASLIDRIPNLAGLARTCEVCSWGFYIYIYYVRFCLVFLLSCPAAKLICFISAIPPGI